MLNTDVLNFTWYPGHYLKNRHGQFVSIFKLQNAVCWLTFACYTVSLHSNLSCYFKQTKHSSNQRLTFCCTINCVIHVGPAIFVTICLKYNLFIIDKDPMKSKLFTKWIHSIAIASFVPYLLWNVCFACLYIVSEKCTQFYSCYT
mgnify:CR=1 FL=1